MYFDWYWLILVVPAMIFALIMEGLVKSRYNKYSKEMVASGMTGFDAARAILDANGLRDVSIAMTSGELTDNYNPSDNTLNLSGDVYGRASVAAVSIACHEAGHAIQHAAGYAPAKFRLALVPVTSLVSKISVPLILIGIILCGFSYFFRVLAYVGIIFFALTVFFQLVTLPVEFDASKRALALLQSEGIVTETEYPMAKSMLTAAALTYVAALAVAVAQLLRLLAIVGGRRR